jgi:hypothetical protein
VGDLMKSARLGPGDVIGVLASRDGRYFVQWNNERVRESAARPTFCNFEFDQHEKAAEAAAAAKEAAAAAKAKAGGGGGAGSGGSGGGSTSRKGRGKGAHAQHAVTAVPMTSAPLMAGMPVSPCEVLVMGPPGAAGGGGGGSGGDGGGDDGGDGGAAAQRGKRSYLRLDSQSSAVVEWTDTKAEAGSAAAGAAARSGDGRADDGEEPAAERVGAIVHQGGALLCPRTPGCTRPAGHQGWCVGRKAQNQKEKSGRK